MCCCAACFDPTMAAAAATDAKGPIDRATVRIFLILVSSLTLFFLQQAPFLVRTFIKPHAHHRILDFEGQLPVADELQVYTWYATPFLTPSPPSVVTTTRPCAILTRPRRMDATLREILLTLRSISSPNHTDLQHPLAKYTFRAVYPDTSVGGGGRFQTKELGTLFARDLSNVAVLSEPFDPDSQQPSNADVMDTDKEERTRREREDRTLEQMRFLPGDYLDIAVILPKGSSAPGGHVGHGVGPGLQIKGAVVAAAAANATNGGMRGPPVADRWGPSPAGRGGPAAGGHWRGGGPATAGSSGRGGAPGSFGAGRGGGGGGFGRDREREREIPPPREPRVVRERNLREEKRERDERDDRPSRFEKERRARELRDDRARERDRPRDFERAPRNPRRPTPPRRGGGGQVARRRSYTRSISASRSRSRSPSPPRRRSRSRD